ncbi:MCE family protein [Mycolicibacterium vaccae]|uniref:MCE family protein n=1 Tax=Mycolicibacterium vaccae TaxID=1810 RepID=UPI003D08FD1E
MKGTGKLRSTVVAATVVVAVSGCSDWKGINSLPLPGTAGGGPGAFTIQAQLPDVDNIDQNSRVRIGDVTVGNVTKIELQGWHALVSMRLDGDAELPENATAKIGQTSLLGSLHIELAPPVDEPPRGRLKQGSLIPLPSGSKYPSTEQTLAAVSMLLNGGGLGQIEEITEALSVALAGREDDLRSLIEQLDVFTRNVDDQTDDIIEATDSLNRVTGQFAEQKPVIDNAIKTIPDALAVVRDQREQLATALTAIGQYSALMADTTNQTKDTLVRELQDIAPVLKALADSGPALTRSLGFFSTFPFPKDTIANFMRGDYANLTGVIDLTLSRLDAAWLTGTRFEGNLTELEMQWGRTIGQMPSPYTGGNPLVVPYRWDQGR